MSRTTKLILDIVIGAVIPILVLNNLSKPLGATAAYVLAALIPVAWVALDLFVITKRFNVITSFTGLSALVNGILAFWFVDGLLYALKDTAGVLVALLVFGGSLLVGRPIITAFVTQALDPNTPERERSLRDLIALPNVHRSLAWGTGLVALGSLITGVINIYLNLHYVVDRFGTDAFNSQVAYVNAISRIAYPLISFAGFGAAFWVMYRALYKNLLRPGEAPFEQDFWELVERREGTGSAEAAEPSPPEAAQ